MTIRKVAEKQNEKSCWTVIGASESHHGCRLRIIRDGAYRWENAEVHVARCCNLMSFIYGTFHWFAMPLIDEQEEIQLQMTQ
jgi:hypothetical protein